METKAITFDDVFKIWIDEEVGRAEGVDILPVAESKGFTSISEWRLATTLRMGMDRKEWNLKVIENPNELLPNVIIGPYQGWSMFFDNKLDTTFTQALEIPEFYEWCKGNDRIMALANKFPKTTTLILFQREDGRFIHVMGGHRICAIAYRKKINDPFEFTSDRKIAAAIASINDSEIPDLIKFLHEGTYKKTAH